MRIRECVVCRQAGLVGLVAHSGPSPDSIWRYIIEREDNGEELCDGWAADAEEAQQSVEQHLAYMLDRQLRH
jgi:hypothetical protein